MRAAAFLFVFALRLAGQSTIAVEGTVEMKSGAPVGGVLVELRRMEARTKFSAEPEYKTTTDERGHFSFATISKGDYVPSFVKSGLVAYEAFAAPGGNGWWSAGEQAGPMPIFHVDADKPTIKLTASLEPKTQVSGRVVDEENRPVPDMHVALVTAIGHVIRGGRTSDAEGRFTITAPSGSYYLFAAREISPFARTGPMIEGLRYWYPGVIQSEEAQPVQVRAGVQYYEIKIRTVPVYRVRGVVWDEKGTDPAPGVTVRLYQLDHWDLVDTKTVSGKDGAFHFDGVPDGTWRLFAANTGDPAMRTSYAEIHVSKGNLQDVEMRLVLPWSQKGHFEQDDGAIATAMNVHLIPVDFPLVGEAGLITGLLGEYGMQREADGRFRIEKVYPGRYRILATASSTKFYLASILIGERDVLGDVVELREGAPAIRVVYRSDGGVVQGSSAKCAGATVALVPEEKALFNQFVRTAKCDQNGHFAMSNVRPGDYSMLAFQDSNAVRDERYVRSLFVQGENVRIKPRETTSVELRGVIPVE